MNAEIFGGHNLGRADALVVEGVLQRLKSNGKRVTPKALLEASRSQLSPTHRFFEWDNGKAAHQHRLQQAAELIREVTIEIRQDANDKPRRVRAYVSVTQGGQRFYEETTHVLSTQDLREQLLTDALREMRSFQEKYRTLTELAHVFEAIEKVKRRRKAA